MDQPGEGALVADVDLGRVQVREAVPLEDLDGAALAAPLDLGGRALGRGLVGEGVGDVLALLLGLALVPALTAAPAAAAPGEEQRAGGYGREGRTRRAYAHSAHGGLCTCLSVVRRCLTDAARGGSTPHHSVAPGRHRPDLGSNASLTESPSKLNARMKITIAPPGKNM